MRRCPWTVLLLLACVFPAFAQGAGAVRKQVEASMLVTGEITIRVDGSVAAVVLDKPEKLPKGIPEFVSGNAVEWRFEPVLVEGKPAQVRTKMSVRLVGKSMEGNRMMVSIRGADFGDYEALPEAERITGRKLAPPGYPPTAAENRVQGTVYLLVRIERDGTVSDVVAEQVNLRLVAGEGHMNLFRQQLARAAVAAARRWTFNPPTQGEAAEQSEWVARVPVAYVFPGGDRAYGQWETYVPGPRQVVAWAQDEPGFSPDALAEGGIYLAGNKGPKLLTLFDQES